MLRAVLVHGNVECGFVHCKECLREQSTNALGRKRKLWVVRAVLPRVSLRVNQEAIFSKK